MEVYAQPGEGAQQIGGACPDGWLLMPCERPTPEHVATRDGWAIPATSRKDVEANRLRAYADPLTGSDRYFAEATRMQAVGEDDWEEVLAIGVARYQQIQSDNPWPDED